MSTRVLTGERRPDQAIAEAEAEIDPLPRPTVPRRVDLRMTCRLVVMPDGVGRYDP